MKDFCILGSGISGSTIANLLSKKYSLEIFDKARGVGGRSSNKRFLKKLSFDHGLQYLSPKNKKFEIFVKKLTKIGVLKVWKGNHLDYNFKNTASLNKFIGKNGNSDISKYLIGSIKVNLQASIKKINFIKNYWIITLENEKKCYFKNLIITSPFPQTKLLSGKYIPKKIKNLNVKMEPNITVMAIYKKSSLPVVSSIKFNDKIISWAANENTKSRYKSKLTLWTIQSNIKWAKKYINNYKDNKSMVSRLLLARFNLLTGFKNKNLVFKNIHGWKYSYNLKSTNMFSYWSNKHNLGICGDWFIGPKVEHAWLSANDLFKTIKKSLHK
jgi:predicted NAD/FAD-dependent oxidoreductase